MTDPSQYFRGRTVQEQMNEVIGYVDVRSAEVATDAIAADVAQVHSDAADAHADALAAAASAAAAAGTLANAVKKTGEASQSIAGNIEVSGTLKAVSTLYATGDANVGGNLGVGGSTNVGNLTATGVVTVPTPTGNTHAANKKYVDDADALKINISDINSYAVGLTGNQNPIAGTKTFTSPLTRYDATGTAPILNQMKMGNLDRTSVSSLRDLKIIVLTDMNDLEVFRLQLRKFNKTTTLYAVITDSAGTEHSSTLASYTEP